MIFLPFSPMRLFIYEHVTAGGCDFDPPESLLREGRAMRDAVAEDFGRIPGVRAEILPDDRLRHAGEADATLVIAPEFQDRLYACSRVVYGAGGRLLGSPPRAVWGVIGKESMYWRWSDVGVPAPRTVTPKRVDQLPDPP
jgi:tyramine---L-glutamate ligase